MTTRRLSKDTRPSRVIRIDTDLYQFIAARAHGFDTPNMTLRRLLGIDHVPDRETWPLHLRKLTGNVTEREHK